MVKPQALRLVRWPGIFQDRWLNLGHAYSSFLARTGSLLASPHEVSHTDAQGAGQSVRHLEAPPLQAP